MKKELPNSVSLADKYNTSTGRVFISGVQALVRLPMLQQERDQLLGKKTAGFISGYRGSPLGGFDLALESAKPFLDAHHIVFQPGVNEELAATAIWGSQQLHFAPVGNTQFDGVFGIWYGKGPGVDRSMDVFKHANMAGTAPWGGVIAVAGDDHLAKSSTAAHQSDHVFKACGFPVFFPSSPQEILDLGLHAFALSRFAGIWSGFKTIQDVVESSSTVEIDIDRVKIITPSDFELPINGVHIRWPDERLAQEERLFTVKWFAALAYIRANRLNHNVIAAPTDRLGLITSGKAYNDTRQALKDLGLDEKTCNRVGLRLHKVAVVWPLEAQLTREFAVGLQEILVIEEKRQLIEYQLKEELYNWREDVRPRVVGKFEEEDGADFSGGEWSRPNPTRSTLLRAHRDLNPALIAKAIAKRLIKLGVPDDVKAIMMAHLDMLNETQLHISRITHGGSNASDQLDAAVRTPWFCSGCPHNRSTTLPEGSFVAVGIGCHYMVNWMNRGALGFTQMGGEGVTWVGQQPFSTLPHMFANLGDGTYFHSGILAIRQAVAASSNITYKILYNDAVAMTGGQIVGEHRGEKGSPWLAGHTVMQIAQSLKAEGVKRIVVLTDDVDKYTHLSGLPHDVPVLNRRELERIQLEFREIKGVTALIYDQTCATEKRRRRKRGKLAAPDKRIFINDLVCEGCGDCNIQSNCLSVEPLETEFGRKRKINQSSCNFDYSCVDGFCPSFVTLEGSKLKRKSALNNITLPTNLPEPILPNLEADAWGILIAGVGGTGVITIGQILGMAAHIERRGVVVQDCAGLAQKGGATWSHIFIGKTQDSICTTHIGEGSADLLLACDPIVAAMPDSMIHLGQQRSHIVLNTNASPTSDFLSNADWKNPSEHCQNHLKNSVNEHHFGAINADQLASEILGNSIFTNPILLGFAWQKGWLPLSKDSIFEAFKLNGVECERNCTAFEWGRFSAFDLKSIHLLLAKEKTVSFVKRDEQLSAFVAKRVDYLTQYQNQAYALKYQTLVEKIAKKESLLGAEPRDELTKTVAKYLFKLMVIKDEYEVARLLVAPEFKNKINEQFEGDFKVQYHLAPPLWSKKNAKNQALKQVYSGSIYTAGLQLLAKFKRLRGTPFDVFAKTKERKREIAWKIKYQEAVTHWSEILSPENYAHILQQAKIPEHIRGYGHVRENSMDNADSLWRAH